jgi:hypothetical protein
MSHEPKHLEEPPTVLIAPPPPAKKAAAKKAANGLTMEKLLAAKAILDADAAEQELGERAMTKSGRPLVVVTAGDLPPPPPPIPLGTVLRKDKIAAAYYDRVSDSTVPFSHLSINAQSEWYNRAMNAGGPK